MADDPRMLPPTKLGSDFAASAAPARSDTPQLTATGALPIEQGGTGGTTPPAARYNLLGVSGYVKGDLLYAASDSNLARLADIATGNVLLSGGVGAAPSYGKVGLTTHVSGTLAATNGGTGFASYAVGDVLYADTTTTLAKLADVATGNSLISGGIGTAPSWGKIGLTTHVSGTLGPGNGGTGLASYTIGDLLYASGTTTLSKLADVATGNALISGGIGVAPAWGKIDITTTITGRLPFANLAQGTARSVLAIAGNATADFASVQGTADQVLVINSAGTGLAFGQVNLAAAVAITGDLPFANLAQGSARSVLGVTGNATADVASIQGTADQALVVNSAGTGLAFGALNLAAAAAVTGDLPFSSLAQGTARSLLGVTGNSTADVASIQGTANQVPVINSAGTALAFGAVNLASSAAVTGTLPAGNLPTGSVVQSTYAEYTTNADLATTVPLDDTIPQSTEGTQVLTASLTPASSTNKIRARFRCHGTIGTASTGLVAALFVNSNADASRSAYVSIETIGFERQITLEYEFTPGATSSQTIAIRVGPTSGTARLNGTTVTRLFGGTLAATLVLEEIKA